MKKAKLIESNGKLMCPDCDDSELSYCQSFHRRDAFKARFDKKTDRLVMIGDPLLGLSDTLSVYDEYLHCPKCKGHYDPPWPDDSDREQFELPYEGDFFRMTSPDEVLLNECPLCRRNDRVKHLEQYDISRDARSTYKDRHGQEFIVLGDEDKIEFDGGGEGERLQCQSCFTQWSMPRDVEPMT